MAKDVTIQLLVVVDKEMISFHGNQSIEEYVLTIMNMVNMQFDNNSWDERHLTSSYFFMLN